MEYSKSPEKTERPKDPPLEESKVMCEFHPQARSDLYCLHESCRKVICPICLRLYHEGHDYKHLSEIAEEMKWDYIGERYFDTQHKFQDAYKRFISSIRDAKDYYLEMEKKFRDIIWDKVDKLQNMEKEYEDLSNYEIVKLDERKQKAIIKEIDTALANLDYGKIVELMEAREVENERLRTISGAREFTIRMFNKLEFITNSITTLEDFIINDSELDTKSLHAIKLEKYHISQDHNSHLGYFENKQLKLFCVADQMSKTIDVDINIVHPELIEVNGKIYFVGNYGYSPETYEIEISTSILRERASLKHPKYMTHLVHWFGMIYSVGMWKSQAEKYCEKFSIEKNEWYDVPSLNSPKYYTGGCLFADRYIYVFGGDNGWRDVEDVEILDCEHEINGWVLEHIALKGGWRCLNSPGAVQIDADRILVFGGCNPTRRSAFIFTPEKRGFQRVANMKEIGWFNYGRSNTSVLRHNKVYSLDSNNKIHIYDIKEDLWELNQWN